MNANGALQQDPILHSEAALEAFIAAFLDGTFPGDQWHHREHIVMAAWHLTRYDEADTIERIRAAIKHYRIARGGLNDETSGYHETLTLFWIRLTAEALGRQPSQWTARERIFAVANELGPQTRLDREYYSFDALASTAARLAWIAPDRKPLPAAPKTPIL
jgi:hypothetical protein